MSKPINHRIIQFQTNHIAKIDPTMIQRILWLDTFSSGQRWLDRMTKETRTHEIYLYLFQKFCDSVGKNPDELVKIYIQGFQLQLTQGIQNFVIQDLMTQTIPQMKMCDGSPISAPTQRHMEIAISSFFRANGFLLHYTFIVTSPKIKGLPTIPEIQDMINTKIPYGDSKVMTDLYFARNQALTSFFASTGFRPETVSLLKWCDLKPTNNNKVPIVIVVDPTRMKGKGVSQRYTFTYQTSFLHAKAYDYLMKYKAMIKPKDDDAIFAKYPHRQIIISMSPMGFWQAFSDISDAVWQGKKRYACNSFRHFVSNAYTFAGLQDIDILMLTGHAVTSILKFYVNVNPNNPIQHPKIQDLLKKYETAIPYLC
jgi:hypothetical protein